MNKPLIPSVIEPPDQEVADIQKNATMLGYIMRGSGQGWGYKTNYQGIATYNSMPDAGNKFQLPRLQVFVEPDPPMKLTRVDPGLPDTNLRQQVIQSLMGVR